MSVNQQILKNKRIIVTGASSGIGEHLCWHIAKHGGIPIMIARSGDKLEKLQEKLKGEFAVKAYIYQTDVTDHEAYSDVLAQIVADHQQIYGLINNAGAGVFAAVEEIQWDDLERMFQLNVFGLINGTKQLLPHFSANRRICHIVNIASLAGKVATPKSAVYAATKHAVLGFTNVLRLEVERKKIYVTAVNLGPVKTDFFTQADPTGSYQKNVSRYMLDPDKVAKKVIKHLFQKKREINLPHWMAFGAKLYQLFPSLIERLAGKKLYKK
ncbi:SDR family oxidoreductase [Lentibacillus sp. N15]|uniref:SDR family NAD(P)-dependent oxidoreductase n=1 Tax=Lentibacillus songyuanensis TaxID=3136161 RepID=UPI0031BA0EDE